MTMMIDSSTGIDLNDAGRDLQGVDMLWDIPGVLMVARVRYANGTRLEIAQCSPSMDCEDFQTVRRMIPTRSVPLRGWTSETLGCGHGDEYTTAYWIFE
jgi:hypothetical protein